MKTVITPKQYQRVECPDCQGLRPGWRCKQATRHSSGRIMAALHWSHCLTCDNTHAERLTVSEAEAVLSE